MKTKEVQRLLNEDPRFVNLSRFHFNIDEVIERFPDGAPTKLIAQAMLITEEEVDEIVRKSIFRLRAYLGVEVDHLEDPVDP